MTNLLQCISPIDGSLYAERPVLTQDQAAQAVARARKAQKAWGARPWCVLALPKLVSKMQRL